jgi:hypothetical protein
MSGLNLNLLPSQAKFQAAKIKLQKKVRLILMVMVSVWVLVLGVTFVINIVSKVRINIVQAQYDKARNDYMSMSDNIVTSQRLKYKAKLVGGVLKDRFEYGKAFGRIIDLFLAGITIKDIELKNRGTFVIKGETSGRENVDELETIIENINIGRNEDFSKANLLNVSLLDNVWTFQMEVSTK